MTTTTAPLPSSSAVRTAAPDALPDASAWIDFDVHGLARLRVAADAPTAPQLRAMFAPFATAVRASEPADLVVTADHEPMRDATHGDTELTFTRDAVVLRGPQVQVVREGRRFRVHGRRELLTTVLPLLDRVLVQKRAAMIHAATFSVAGHGVAMPAWGGVGKTSTMAKLTRRADVEFFGDDWAFVTARGDLLGFAKPMFIKPHHRDLYPHLFAGARKPLIPSRLSDPVARLTTLVHPAVTRYPQLAAASRRWSPEHRMVTPAEALPGARTGTRAPLGLVVFVERWDADQTLLVQRDTRWMVRRVLGNFHIEMPRHAQHLVSVLGATGIVPLDAAYSDKADVLASAFEGRPVHHLRVPAALSADDASDQIVERLLGLVAGLPR
jgi:hypothetical protein